MFSCLRCAIVGLLFPAVAHAQHVHASPADSTTRHLGAMAVGVLTTADPALLGRRYTEGYLTQPNIMGDVRLGPLAVTGTLNLEGYTLQRGELNAGIYGEGYVDRRHPHTLVHEVMFALASPSRGGVGFTMAGGKGFTPYGTDDPMMRPFVKYPVNHHHAQIIERVQVIGAVQMVRGDRRVTLEHGLFNGDEPVGPFAEPQWSRTGDLRSTRLTVNPTRSLEWQASQAFVRSPGLTQGGAFDHQQRSVSLRYRATPERTMAHAGHAERYALIEFARTDESLGRQRVFRFESVLAEATTVHHGWALSARAERTERPESSRQLDLFRIPNGHVDFQIVGITRWSIGTVQLVSPAVTVPKVRGTRLLPFVEVARAHAAARRTPAVFVPSEFYGSAVQWSLSIGARVHAGHMRQRMGRYTIPVSSTSSYRP